MDMSMKESPHDGTARVDHRDIAFLLLLHYCDVNAKRDLDRISLMWAERNDMLPMQMSFIALTAVRTANKAS